MEKKALLTDLNPADSKTLIIVPNLNSSIIAAAMMARFIGNHHVSVIFIDNNRLDELRIDPKVERIYALGIGPQNCDAGRLEKFIWKQQDRIYLWANNCDNFKRDLSIALGRCPELQGMIIGNKPSVPHLLFGVLGTNTLPREWVMGAEALANYKKYPSNNMALRFKKVAYVAEAMDRYSNDGLAAKARRYLLEELLTNSSLKEIENLLHSYPKIKEETLKVIAEASLVDQSDSLIIQRNRIFDHDRVCGKLLARFNPIIIQYRDLHGNCLTELCTDKSRRKEFEAIAKSLSDDGFCVCIGKSRFSVKGDWKTVRKIIENH